MGVTVVWTYEPDQGSTLVQAISQIHTKLEDMGASRDGKFNYKSEFYKSVDPKAARNFYTLETSEYPATIFARVDDGNKNTCMQCDSPLESKFLAQGTNFRAILGLLLKIRDFFKSKRKYEVQGRTLVQDLVLLNLGVRWKIADFWIRPGIVTSNGNNRALTVEIEYAPSVKNRIFS